MYLYVYRSRGTLDAPYLAHGDELCAANRVTVRASSCGRRMVCSKSSVTEKSVSAPAWWAEPSHTGTAFSRVATPRLTWPTAHARSKSVHRLTAAGTGMRCTYIQKPRVAPTVLSASARWCSCTDGTLSKKLRYAGVSAK